MHLLKHCNEPLRGLFRQIVIIFIFCSKKLPEPFHKTPYFTTFCRPKRNTPQSLPRAFLFLFASRQASEQAMGVISLAPYSSKTLPIFCSSQSDNSGFVDSKSLLSSVEKSNRALFCSTKTKYVRKRISYRISAAAETETLNGSTSHEDFQFDSIEQAIQDIRDGKVRDVQSQ